MAGLLYKISEVWDHLFLCCVLSFSYAIIVVKMWLRVIKYKII